MTLANWPGRRCSRLRTSRPLIPYSASPERPRRPYCRGIDRAHVNGRHLDGISPGRGSPGQPVCGVIGGAALHLPQQAVIPGQVKEARVPPTPRPGPGQVAGPGQHELMHPARTRPAVWAHRRGRMTGDRPDRQRAIGFCLGLDDLQALHAEQRGGDIVNHSARGSLMIVFPLARSMILEAAGLSITAPRRRPHPAGPARVLQARCAQKHRANYALSSQGNAVPANFVEPEKSHGNSSTSAPEPGGRRCEWIDQAARKGTQSPRRGDARLSPRG